MRVDLPLSFVNTRLHVGNIGFPVSLLIGFLIECIRIRIKADTFELAENHSCNQFSQILVLIDHWKIRPDLCSRVPEPHGGDVTGIDKCVILPDRMNGSVQCVRKTIGEHPPELVVCKQGCDFIDLGLDSLGHKESVLRGWTLRFVFYSLGTN